MAAMITLITGGIKSGKSAFALELAEERFSEKTYIATAIVEDDEMRERVRLHREERDGSYVSIEEPVDLDTINGENCILDDLTVWVGNLYRYGKEKKWQPILERFFKNLSGGAIVITNETGWGNVPMDPMTRDYNRTLGSVNMFVAALADEVFLMAAGIPVEIKKR